MVCIVKDIVESVLSKLLVFPVVMYRCESWTIKKAEHWRIDAFELWWWRRFLRVPFTARTSNQSILKEIRPEYSLEGLMLDVKAQYFGHLMWKTDSLEKTLMLQKIEGRRRRGWQRTRWLDGIPDAMDMSLSRLWSWWWTGKPGVLQSMGSQRVWHDWATELNWTELKLNLQYFGYLMWRADSLEKTLMLGKIDSRRRSGQQRMRWLDGIIDLMNMSLSKFRKTVKDRGSLACWSLRGWKSWTWQQLNNNHKIHAIIIYVLYTLCDSMDCSLPGSSVHEILQSRIFEEVAMHSSRWSSLPCLSHLPCRWILYCWATREAININIWMNLNIYILNIFVSWNWIQKWRIVKCLPW